MMDFEKLIYEKKRQSQQRQGRKRSRAREKEMVRDDRRSSFKTLIVKLFRRHLDDNGGSRVCQIALDTAELLRLTRHVGRERPLLTEEVRADLEPFMSLPVFFVNGRDRAPKARVSTVLAHRSELILGLTPNEQLHLKVKCNSILQSQDPQKSTYKIAAALATIVGRPGEAGMIPDLRKRQAEEILLRRQEQLASYDWQLDEDGTEKIWWARIPAPRFVIYFTNKRGNKRPVAVFPANTPDIEGVVGRFIDVHINPQLAPGRRVACPRGVYDLELLEKGGQKLWLKDLLMHEIKPPVRIKTQPEQSISQRPKTAKKNRKR